VLQAGPDGARDVQQNAPPIAPILPHLVTR